MSKLTRRQWVKGLTAAGVALGAPFGASWQRTRASDGSTDPRFLIVLAASGGGSIIDSLLAIRASESANGDTINAFPDEEVLDIDGTPFRAVDMRRPSVGPIPIGFQSNQSEFVMRNQRDLMVATWTRTSVNHAVGQRRAVTGNEAWAGRTMQEIVANQYGAGFPLPNVHLATDNAVSERGNDSSLPSFAFGETVADPALWPLALDGVKGLPRPVSRALVERARTLRNERLEPGSAFNGVFNRSATLAHWRRLRGEPQRAIEGSNLIDKLLLFPDSAQFPLAQYGLTSSQDAERLIEVFPDILTDPLDAQAALAFLLLKNRVSVTVTLGPSFDVALADGATLDLGSLTGGGGGGGGDDEIIPEGSLLNTPIAFDFSHQAHRATQALMWNRIFRVAGGLIELLKSEEYGDGQSLWDRTMIYIAPDFGRSKRRPAGAPEFGSGHDLNNGVIALSPMVNGNRVLGGVDRDTGLTYGFDPSTGDPDLGRNMDEPTIFAGLLQALGIDTSEAGLGDVPSMRG